MTILTGETTPCCAACLERDDCTVISKPDRLNDKCLAGIPDDAFEQQAVAFADADPEFEQKRYQALAFAEAEQKANEDA